MRVIGLAAATAALAFGGAARAAVVDASPTGFQVKESGATGHLVWSLDEKAGKTTLTQTYFVGGYYPGGLGALAPAVDGVLAEQLGRLKAYVETGKPG
jgi:hypothetical protein